MNITGDELLVWARTVYGEARGEHYDGMVAVAWVIRNRVEADLHGDNKPDWWGEGVIGVCKKPFQFSCWNPTDPNGPKMHLATLDDAAFQDAICAVIEVAHGRRTDPTAHSTHYHRSDIAPDWAIGKTYITIGRHRFYRGIE